MKFILVYLYKLFVNVHLLFKNRQLSYFLESSQICYLSQNQDEKVFGLIIDKYFSHFYTTS
ncbi:hypothetical protein EV194_105256 [Natronoflexus pectinivorans]|uniref:Uncharacterized protein n=1 Tax=Natronoflexus pectinivorans TaxID=682526 RepID=A0A4R2GIU9_9BACT|nr:hypothetical protein EV194_105256 [Natronoflexus pectinivorans]